jgi:hypothetical protein
MIVASCNITTCHAVGEAYTDTKCGQSFFVHASISYLCSVHLRRFTFTQNDHIFIRTSLLFEMFRVFSILRLMSQGSYVAETSSTYGWVAQGRVSNLRERSKTTECLDWVGRTFVSDSGSHGFRSWPEDRLSRDFSVIPKSLRANGRIVPQIRPRPLLSSSSPIHLTVRRYIVWSTDRIIRYGTNKMRR